MSVCRPRASELVLATLIAAWTLVSGRAEAACSTARPTTVGASWAYDASAELASYAPAGGAFRVWYAQTGRHAVADAAATGDAGTPEQVPGSVQLAATIAEEARLYFAESLGFALPAVELPTADCDDASADGLIDIYLVDFAGSADGTVGYDNCGAVLAEIDCSGFVIIENDFRGGGYPDFETALRTVLPHEYFHLVQGSYSRSMDSWWAEGTAQWAADALHPELTDLEGYLPAYFSDVERPLDLPPATAAQPFSYGAAIFPVFLAESFGSSAIRDTFLAQREDLNALTALEQTLSAAGSSLADSFGTFARWNAATGSRADTAAGYQNAPAYPRVELKPFDATRGSVVRGATAGLSAHYYAVAAADSLTLSLEADLRKTQAWVLPLLDGRVALDKARALPAQVFGDAILVVAGLAPAKIDAPYEIAVSEPSASAQPEESEPPSASTERPIATESGCSVPRSASRGHAGVGFLLMLAAASLRRGGRP
jgi:hypothetical protein